MTLFDNRLGPSNDKWCCGRGGGIPKEGLHVTAEFEEQYALTHFTLSSANDVPPRDPTVWRFRGRTTAMILRLSFLTTGIAFGISDCKSSFLRQGKMTTFKKPGIGFFGMLLLTPHRTRLGRTFKLAKLSSSAMIVIRRP